MATTMSKPLEGHHTQPGNPASMTPDGRAERLARQFTPAACRRAVAAFDRLGLPGPADLWHRAALLAVHRPPPPDPSDERGSAC